MNSEWRGLTQELMDVDDEAQSGFSIMLAVLMIVVVGIILMVTK